MLDILIALIFAGCIYGIARAWGRLPNYPRVAGWTGAVMFAIAAWVEFSIARSGEVMPSLGRLVPIALFAVVMFRIGRKTNADDSPAAADRESRRARWTSFVQEVLDLFGLEVRPEGLDQGETRAAAEGG
jgi:hypothetical protein